MGRHPFDRPPAVKLVFSQEPVEELADGDALRLGAGHAKEAALRCLQLAALLLEDFERLAFVGRLGRRGDDSVSDSR
jgi:hypothetical protein